MTFYRMSTLEKDSVTLYSTIHCNQIRGIKIRLLQNNPSLPSNQRPIFFSSVNGPNFFLSECSNRKFSRTRKKAPGITKIVDNLASNRDLNPKFVENTLLSRLEANSSLAFNWNFWDFYQSSVIKIWNGNWLLLKNFKEWSTKMH